MNSEVTSAYSITYLDSIPSTNDAMLARIRAGLAAPGEVIVAREQTRGRGRMGRQWSSEAGGLWFTAAMPPYGEHVGWAGMLAALAVCRALDEIGLRAGVKWPNDVVVDRKKLGGVLVEMVAGRDLAAVGVGLNVRNRLPLVSAGAAEKEGGPPGEPVSTARRPFVEGSGIPGSAGVPPASAGVGETIPLANTGLDPAAAPAATREGGFCTGRPSFQWGASPVRPAGPRWLPTSVLQETARAIDPWSLLEPILARMGELWRVWEADSLTELQAAWAARDVSRGHRVKLLPDGPEGVANGIDPTGALRVRLPDGRETLARAGELTFIDRERREQ